MSDQRAAAAVVALAAVVVLVAPWLGLAQVSARTEALAVVPRRSRVDAAGVADQVGNADVAVLALRIGAGLVLVGLTPLVAVTLHGALLAAAVALASLLGTRALFGRAEVLVGVVTGLLTAVAAGATVTVVAPDLLGWVVGLALVVGAFVLAFNVVSPRMRPWLTRAADALHLVALLSVLPLAAMVWGLG